MAIRTLGKPGTGLQYTTWASALAALQDGDELHVEALDAAGNQAEWPEAGGLGSSRNNIKIRGMLRGIPWGKLADDGLIREWAAYQPIKPRFRCTSAGDYFVFTGRNVDLENIDIQPDNTTLGQRGSGWATRFENSLAGDTCRIRFNYIHEVGGNGLSIAHGNRGNFFVKYNHLYDCGSNNDQEHNAYVTTMGEMWIVGNHSHRERGEGHLFKTRSATNYVLFNTFSDKNDPDSIASGELDIPWGGKCFILGNLMVKMPNLQGIGSTYLVKINHEARSGGSALETRTDGLGNLYYAAEIPFYRPSRWVIAFNTFVNYDPRSGGGLWAQLTDMNSHTLIGSYGNDAVFIKGNVLAGLVNTSNGFGGPPISQAVGTPSVYGFRMLPYTTGWSLDFDENVQNTSLPSFAFRDEPNGDYRPTAASTPLINAASDLPTNWNGYNLRALMTHAPGWFSRVHYRPGGA